MENFSKKVKINILTGFFGSGKTTLINNIIKSEKLENKVAIVQNEFSDEMGIEKEILTDGEGKSLGDLYELANGCMCCAVKDNMIVFLENLIVKKDNIENIIIEPHGISDMSLFWLDKELESPLVLNSIICIIDSLNFEKNKSEMYEIFTNQIISADKILVNKIDQINYDQEKIKQISEFVKSINPFANINTTEFSKISLEYFLEGCENNSESSVLSSCQIESQSLPHEHFHEKEEIENIIVNINIKTKSELDKKIGNLIWDLTEIHNFSIIRFKGILYSQEGILYSLQGLYDLYEIEEIRKFQKSEISKILFIGKNLKKNKTTIENFINSE